MMGKTHVVGGAMAFVVVAPLFDVPWYGIVAGLPLAMSAALGPDIDHPNSAIGRVVPWAAWAVSRVTTHRVQTHSLVSIAMIIFAMRPLGVVPVVATATGWASHILLDGVTKQGVAWFWPLSREKTSLLWFLDHLPKFLRKRLQIVTNSTSETVFTGIMSLSFAGYCVMRLIV